MCSRAVSNERPQGRMWLATVPNARSIVPRPRMPGRWQGLFAKVPGAWADETRDSATAARSGKSLCFFTHYCAYMHQSRPILMLSLPLTPFVKLLQVRGPSAPGRGERPAKLQSSPPKAFVGKMGGIRQLFEQRRLRISTSPSALVVMKCVV